MLIVFGNGWVWDVFVVLGGWDKLWFWVRLKYMLGIVILGWNVVVDLGWNILYIILFFGVCDMIRSLELGIGWIDSVGGCFFVLYYGVVIGV